jgi:hypothetical protein
MGVLVPYLAEKNTGAASEYHRHLVLASVQSIFL